VPKVSKSPVAAHGTSRSGHILCMHNIRLSGCRRCGGGWRVLMESGWRVEGFDGEWMEGGGF
jgi:hypothetical protein